MAAPTPRTAGALRVVIVDDHSILRGGLATMLGGEPDLEVVGSYATVGETLAARDARPDVILQDISLPGIGGLEAVPLYRDHFPGARVLMLSMHSPAAFGLRALRAGAHGYLTKDVAPDDLLGAVRQVGAGRRVIPDQLTDVLVGLADRKTARPPHETLSDREYVVFRRLAAGARVSDIARELVISAKTVSTYRRRVLEKLGMENTSELVRYALEHDLLS